MQLVVQPLQRTLDVRAGANLLEVLRQHQVPLSYSCMAGRCGTCRCKIVKGDVLDAGQEATGPLARDRYVLACQTFLTEPCTIEIPEPDEVVVHPARIIKATVQAVESLTHDIRRVVLKPAKPLEFSPGAAWNYSVSIDVLGYLVEKLSSVSFGEFLHTRLFEPLGMNDTAFYVPPDKIERLTSCYQPESKGPGLKLEDDARESAYATPPGLESGGGGLVSTAHDYLRFCRMMLNGGTLDGVQILSPKTTALFSLNYLPEGREIADMALPGMFSESGYAGVGFSLGCGVNVDVAKTRLPGSLGEYFWGGAAATAFWIDPKEELTVVFMTQVIGSEARLTLRRDLRTLVYSAVTESFA